MDHVEFEVVEGGVDEDDDARVAATADLGAWRESEQEFHWPDEPTERVREVLKRLIAHLGLRGSVDIVEHEDEIYADVNGPELGLLIGKHGSTLDAIQFVCSQAAFRGRPTGSAWSSTRRDTASGGRPRCGGRRIGVWPTRFAMGARWSSIRWEHRSAVWCTRI